MSFSQVGRVYKHSTQREGKAPPFSKLETSQATGLLFQFHLAACDVGTITSCEKLSAAFSFSCSPEVLAKIAVVCWFTSWFWRGDRISFEEMRNTTQSERPRGEGRLPPP